VRSPYYPSDTLSDTGRIFRPSLWRWAPALAERLVRAAGGRSEREVVEACSLINNASLVFALAGEDVTAAQICRRQLAWLRAAARDGAQAAASLAIQPWVNLGRLLRQRGEHERALAMFARVYVPDERGLLSFGGFAVPPQDVRYENAELIYVADSLRTYAGARTYERGLRFIRRVRSGVHSVATFPRLDEYEFLFCLRRGYRRAAARVLDRISWSFRPRLALDNAFYRCVLLEREGTDTSRVLADLARWVCGALEADAAPDHCVLRYAHELGGLLAHARRAGPARRVIGAGMRASEKFEDVPLQFGFARLAAGPRRRDAGRDMLAAAGYAGLARRYGFVLTRPVSVARALAALRAALERVLGPETKGRRDPEAVGKPAG
jgi:hypothetical protein